LSEKKPVADFKIENQFFGGIPFKIQPVVKLVEKKAIQ
jgi:hypothetical protein